MLGFPVVARAPGAGGRSPALLRLGALVAVLAALWLLVATTGVVDVAAVRDWMEGAGPLGPVLFVPASMLLAAMLVPGPVLAGASGYLFGPALGTAVTLSAAVCTAVFTSRIGRYAGRDGAAHLIGEDRVTWLDRQIARRGVLAVAGQRLVPGVPDAPVSYTFGALGVPAWQMAVGTMIGSAPRAFAYTAMGAALRDSSGPLAVAALVVWLLMAAAGVEGVRRAALSWRRRRRAAVTSPPA